MAKKTTKTEAKSEKTTTAKTETAKLFCLCGCGKEVTRRFAQGHDARLHSLVLKASREKKVLQVSKDAAAYLKQAPWMTKELAKAFES